MVVAFYQAFYQFQQKVTSQVAVNLINEEWRLSVYPLNCGNYVTKLEHHSSIAQQIVPIFAVVFCSMLDSFLSWGRRRRRFDLKSTYNPIMHTQHRLFSFLLKVSWVDSGWKTNQVNRKRKKRQVDKWHLLIPNRKSSTSFYKVQGYKPNKGPVLFANVENKVDRYTDQ